MAKYDALKRYLGGLPVGEESVLLSFSQIEEIIGAALPASASRHRPWWANQEEGRRPHARAWMGAGWCVCSVDLGGGHVRLGRAMLTSSEPKAQQPTDAGSATQPTRARGARAPDTSSENRLNPARGKRFQLTAARVLGNWFGVEFETDVPIPIGDPPKLHRFDLVSPGADHVGECKSYTWTKTGNVPSAKMAFANEAVFYLQHLVDVAHRFVVLRRTTHPKRSETLADYYVRTYRHLIGNVLILELGADAACVRQLT